MSEERDATINAVASPVQSVHGKQRRIVTLQVEWTESDDPSPDWPYILRMGGLDVDDEHVTVVDAGPNAVAAAREVLVTHAIECTGRGEVTCRCREGGWMSWPDYHDHVSAAVARALAAAGWLRTAEDRAVLDAAERWADMHPFIACPGSANDSLQKAVRARRVAVGSSVPADPPAHRNAPQTSCSFDHPADWPCSICGSPSAGPQEAKP